MSFGDLLDSISTGNLAKVESLLKSSPDLVFARDKNKGATPLHVAASWGFDDIVRVLLGSNAEVNARTNNGATALHAAAALGHAAVVELLLANKAEVDARDSNGRTPLYAAALNGKSAAATVLLSNEADVNAKGNDGETPFQAAAKKDHLDVAEMLRLHGGHE